ncbi:MAG: hypothetical protein V5B31_14885 [Candidatus Accumulibacter propinquus]|jgi:hypothetical protein|uniref:hypothetical protein n=1 Tax=Candidatus Accumulibacter propinquus TaxID=2954380 RepID=UPI002FC3C755
MATSPTPAANQAPASGFQPAFKRVAQTNDFDCWLACIAMIVNRPLAEVRQVAADRFKFPKNGPYTFMDEGLIAKLLANWSFTATVYKESAGIAALPDVCIGMVDYNPETEIGRHVVFVRQRGAAGKPNVEYIIDPAPWVGESQQVRTDIKGFPISWYIGVTPMKPAGK